ncbi:MAG: saccharopine dehydrogenase, partial [Dactylosporangium sp.]|nr:saccharopine dehydrogenase NADP-binding domain-containing protein [Dactylosporangium sp.]NNJ62018.1 saccharopine dehydrogenase [Dactylosporangium sp.]
MTDLDIVVLGATGYTGALTAEYLAAHIPPGLRWGLAGRDLGRLAAQRDRLAASGDRIPPDLPLIRADVTDERSMRALAESTRVLVTTVGPYLRHGEPAVAACAAAGTDYVDLTGEAEFVDLMYLRHQATAERTGARLVHACGFDSVPHDLGALFTVRQLPPDQPIRLHGYVEANASFSGGTVESAGNALARSRQA